MKSIVAITDVFNELRGDPVRTGNALTSAGRRTVLLCVFAFAVLWNGIAVMPREGLQLFTDFSADPGLLSTSHSWNGDAPLMFLLAHFAKVSTLQQFILFSCILTTTTFALLYLLSRTLETEAERLLALLLLLAHPISYILLTWIGMLDAITVLCTAVALFSRSRVLIVAAATIGFCNHPAVALTIPAVQVLRRFSEPDRKSLSYIITAALGIGTGFVCLHFLRASLHIDGLFRLQFILGKPLTEWMALNLKSFPSALYSFHFALWIPVLAMIVVFFRRNPKYYTAWLAVLLASWCIAFFTVDTTRVFALLTWAPTLHALLYTWRVRPDPAARGEKFFRVSLASCAVFGWLAPHFCVVNGVLYSPWFGQFVKYVLHVPGS